MKFLCDRMLGSLAKWLRIIGFDTYFPNSETSDNELLDIAKKENRTLITRDVELVFNARRENIKVINFKTTCLDEQLKLVLKQLKIDKKLFLSRCTLCNSLVTPIKKGEIKEKVPKKVFENKEKFWICKKCDKIYWIGSHYEKMKSKIKNLSN